MDTLLTKNSLFQFVSLFILLFLLTGSCYPVFASEVVLNPALSIDIPLRQQGNPGEFLTYVLTFQNRSSKPLTLEIGFNTDHHWHIMADSQITIPANTGNYYFPLTILIPNDAPAQQIESIHVQIKDLSTNQHFSPAFLEVEVNPVSAIHISSPAPLQGLLGETLSYQINVTNNGNTPEQFSAKAISQNTWKTEITPANFKLLPGESQLITINHHIPTNTNLSSDNLKLTIAWSSQIKTINIQSSIVNKTDILKDKYYIWKGQWSISHPDITDSQNYRLNNSFSLQGQWAPDGWAQLYLSELFNNESQTWYTDIKHKNWELKTGSFWLNSGSGGRRSPGFSSP